MKSTYITFRHFPLRHKQILGLENFKEKGIVGRKQEVYRVFKIYIIFQVIFRLQLHINKNGSR